MSLREDIKPYLDRFGLVQDGGKRDSRNALLNTSLYYVFLVLRGESLPGDKEEFERLLATCRVAPGLFRRTPDCEDLQAHDDYKAICTAAKLLGSDIAEEIFQYGQKHHYVFNWKHPGCGILRGLRENGKFNITPLFGRDLSFVAHTYFCTGRKLPWLLEQAWAWTVETSGKSNRNDQDARKLTWLLIEGMEHTSEECLAAAASWQKRFVQEYPGGLGEVLRNYWNDPNHPLVKYSTL